MSATFTYKDVEALIGGANEDEAAQAEVAERPEVKAFKDALFEKFVKKTLWKMRRDNAMTAENIEFQIDVKVEGLDNTSAAEKSANNNANFSVTLGCCPVDGCSGCAPLDV